MNPFSFLPPTALLTDAYKLSHHQLYPKLTEASAYAEFRRPYDNDANDQRIVFCGLRYLIEQYLMRPWTLEDLAAVKRFASTLNLGNTPYPCPDELFEKIVTENNGYFPVKIRALPEGSVVYPHVPVYTIEASDEYAVLATFLETLLGMSWYPSTVATLSRRTLDVIEASFVDSVDEANHFLLRGRIVDFGMRGCTSPEQAMLGGAAHLLVCDSTETLPGAYYAQFALNDGVPAANTIPATEHSVVLAHASERAAFEAAVETYGDGFVSLVFDSFDYALALERLLPSLKARKIERGGFLVIRPDSGDPVECVEMALVAAERVFGCDINSRGFKVLRGVGVIQGDGINRATVASILDRAVNQLRYSAQNIVFGMGSALLQRINRDTLSFATKLSYVKLADGSERNVMKCPKTDSSKTSLPGLLEVARAECAGGSEKLLPPVVYPKQSCPSENHMLQVVYDGTCSAGSKARMAEWDTLNVVRDRLATQWASYPKLHNPISPQLAQEIENTKARNKSLQLDDE